MEISPLSRMTPLTPIDLAPKTSEQVQMTRTVVAAVRAANKSQLFGDQRDLTFARDQDTQKMVIRIVARGTGEVLDQIPAEVMLRMLEDLGIPVKDGGKP